MRGALWHSESSQQAWRRLVRRCWSAPAYPPAGTRHALCRDTLRAFLAVGGLLFGAKLLDRGKRRRLQFG
jgi:hypothetical protein